MRVPDIRVGLGRGNRTLKHSLEPKTHIPCLGHTLDVTQNCHQLWYSLACVFKVLRRDDWQNVINPGFSKNLTLYPSYMSCTYVHMPLWACPEEPEINLKCYSSGAAHLVLWSFSLGLESQWGWLARKHRGSVCLWFPALKDYNHRLPWPDFHTEAGPELRSLHMSDSIWVTELASQTPLTVLFKMMWAEDTCSIKVPDFHATAILAGISNFRSLKLICAGVYRGLVYLRE